MARGEYSSIFESQKFIRLVDVAVGVVIRLGNALANTGGLLGRLAE